VLVNGSVAEKSARLVSAGEPVVLQGSGPRFVSRGGDKLAAALERFALDVGGAVALDAGASTGGLTDCLLQAGARQVSAVDVGYGQLDQRLREDARVVVLERTNLRHLDVSALRAAGSIVPVDLVTADLSFISLAVVAPVLAGPLLKEGGDLVVLVKPQFEAGKAEVSRGKGVIRDQSIWHRTVLAAASAIQEAGTGIIGAMASPVAGPAGNTEFLLAARAGAPAVGAASLDSLVAGAVNEALARRDQAAHAPGDTP